jgi:hypothetical protein
MGFPMRIHILVIGLVCAGLAALTATPSLAQTANPSSFLLGPNLASQFDWQREWGTIHLNSYADGLNDPGVPSSANGVVPCIPGTDNCSAFSDGVTGGAVIHGIKYDIKNSVVNCASAQLPTCAVSNAGCLANTPPYTRGEFSSIICQYFNNNVGPLGDPYSLVYMPLYDSRSYDSASGGPQQLIINNCVRDIYAKDNGAGAFSPVGHVFNSTEKSSWVLGNGATGLNAGSQLPKSYYYYQRSSDNAWVYSMVAPQTGTFAAGTLSQVDNYSPNLAAIKSYRISDSADGDNFIIVDPNPFFDLRQYAYSGSPEPYANCPVLGLKMYDGICDPTGYAGCNLPVYGVGPTTTATGASGASFSVNNYPVMWSGYALAWSFITPDQYWNNVQNRQDVNGAPLYVKPFNSNPVLMLVRADSYCTNEEMTSDPSSTTTDLPCMQYLQYVTNASQPLGGSFMDLYGPHEDAGTKDNAAAFVLKHDYNFTNGVLDLTSPVMVGTAAVGFFDTQATYIKADGTAALAVDTTIPLGTNSMGVSEPGQLPRGNGTGIDFTFGTSIAVQLNNQPVQWSISGQPPLSLNCIEFTNAPNASKEGKDIFIPTNTLREFQSFADAINAGQTWQEEPAGSGTFVPVGGGLHGLNIYGQPCQTRFELYSAANQGKANPNGTQTWFGTTSCSQIPAPSCNQVTTISAQRYCQRVTGLLGNCSDCSSVTDPDPMLDPGAGGVISSYKITKAANGTDVCYFQAYCHSTSSCPGLATGGHVFCLSPDTKIMMADGSEKTIDSVKAGDVVMSFDAKHARGILKTAKVKATTTTENQKLVQINDLKITPLHKVVLSNGRAVMAKDVKVGDKILKGSGLLMTVKTVKTDLDPITVYNLSLEGDADGYVADGLRVLQYPLPDGLVK